MSILGSSNIKELSLAPSLQDHNGLNMGSPDLFRGAYMRFFILVQKLIVWLQNFMGTGYSSA